MKSFEKNKQHKISWVLYRPALLGVTEEEECQKTQVHVLEVSLKTKEQHNLYRIWDDLALIIGYWSFVQKYSFYFTYYPYLLYINIIIRLLNIIINYYILIQILDAFHQIRLFSTNRRKEPSHTHFNQYIIFDRICLKKIIP